MINYILRLLIFIYAFLIYGIYGQCFQIDQNKNNIIGNIQFTQTKANETFSDIAMRFDIGYYELFEANPNINPDNILEGTIIIIPTKYILPLELKKGSIVINLAEMRLYYYSAKKEEIYIFPIGIGREDWDTPLGERFIIKKTKDPTWTIPESIYKIRTASGEKLERIILPGKTNPLGKYALRLSHGDYLIHGTNVPEGVGRRSSAGCIRLYNHDIEILFNLVEIGTKVIIVNQPYKFGILNKNIYLEAHMPLFEQRLEMGENIVDLSLKTAYEFLKNQNLNLKLNIDKIKSISQEHVVFPREIN